MELTTLSTLFRIEDSLGSLELEAMKIIWDRKRTTVREVLIVINKKKLIAYTTVMTVMDHLYKKKFLGREKIGKTYYYHPLILKNYAVSNSFSNVFKSLISQYGRTKVLSSVIAYSLIPKINFPVNSSYRTPISYGLFLTFCFTLFSLSVYDLLSNLSFFGSWDYLSLFLLEPSLIINKLHLIIFAFIESLPIINILTTVISFVLTLYLLKRLLELLDFKVPFIHKAGGVI